MKIEQYIKNNRNYFDDDLPNEDHFEKFQTKLKRNTINNYSFFNVIKIASVAVAAMLITVFIYEFIIINKAPTKEISQEIREVKMFYTSQANQKIIEINKFDIQDTELEKDLFQKEFKEIDSLCTILENELKTHPDDERIINAVINHYQLKAEVLNQILTNLQNLKQIKSDNHEDIEI